MKPKPGWVVAAACAYEVAAILSGRFPTITQLNERHRIVGAVVVGWLVYHFWLTHPEEYRR